VNTPTRLINRKAVKELALACAQQRARKFTRVSDDFMVGIEGAVRAAVATRVANHPSVGVTLR
jgi:hypothetical protein